MPKRVSANTKVKHKPIQTLCFTAMTTITRVLQSRFTRLLLKRLSNRPVIYSRCGLNLDFNTEVIPQINASDTNIYKTFSCSVIGLPVWVFSNINSQIIWKGMKANCWRPCGNVAAPIITSTDATSVPWFWCSLFICVFCAEQ